MLVSGLSGPSEVVAAKASTGLRNAGHATGLGHSMRSFGALPVRAVLPLAMGFHELSGLIQASL
eukprot:10228282-Alexandrium_andersonii.AAC.1